MTRDFRLTVACVAVLVGMAGQGQAGVINFDVAGESNASADDFYGITFTSGSTSEFIASIKYTLPSGVFDALSVVPTQNVNVASLNGLTLPDISFNPPHSVGTNGPELTVSFVASSFGVGDSFRFGYDVDGLLGSNSNAEPFGIQSVLVEVKLENGSTGSDTFAVVNPAPDGLSTAEVTTGATAAVPEPSSLALLAMGAIGLIGYRQRRRKQAA